MSGTQPSHPARLESSSNRAHQQGCEHRPFEVTVVLAGCAGDNRHDDHRGGQDEHDTLDRNAGSYRERALVIGLVPEVLVDPHPSVLPSAMLPPPDTRLGGHPAADVSP